MTKNKNYKELQGVLHFANLSKTYPTVTTDCTKNISVFARAGKSLNAGQCVALVGPSGSGKSSLLQVLGLLDAPDSGDIHLHGQRINFNDDALCTRMRRDYIGFIFQFHHLLEEFTALENVALPCMIAGSTDTEAQEIAHYYLAKMQLEHRAQHYPSQLSGGEQQRTAIARALANKPKVILADEPTGNLDPVTAEIVFSLFQEICNKEGVALIMATHNLSFAARMDATWEMKDFNP
ncbi:MAG: ABC transporter ATP-binding protein [Alphaproteobacteria bacterium]|nr:MAG: ABC transporter ATP-binding protein [Alphaproteobacteria bacterium]